MLELGSASGTTLLWKTGGFDLQEAPKPSLTTKWTALQRLVV
jgi:hypothetical protein